MREVEAVSDTIAFIGDFNQYASLKKQMGEDSVYAVATADADVRYLAEQDGHVCQDLHSFLDNDDVKLCMNRVEEWTEAVGDIFSGMMVLDECDIVSNMKYDLHFIYNEIAYCTRAVDKLMKSVMPDSVIYFCEKAKTEIWTGISVQGPDLFNAIVDRVIKRSNVRVRVISMDDAKPLTITMNTKHKKEKLGASQISEAVFPATVKGLSIADELMREQEYLWQTLSAEKRWNWMVVTGKCVVQSITLPSCPFLSLKWVDALPYRRTGKCQLLVRLKERREAGFNEDVLFLFDPVFDFVWQAFSECLDYARTAYLRAKWLCSAYAPSLVVTNWDGFGRIRCMGDALKKQGIQKLSVTHSAPTYFRDSEGRWERIMYQCAEGHATAAGPIETHILSSTRLEGGRVFPIGSLRIELAELMEREVESASGDCYQAGQVRIQIITATLGFRYICEVSLNNAIYYNSMADMGQLIANHPDWCFELRKHPLFDFAHAYGKMGLGNLANLRQLADDERRTMTGISVALLYNNPSTVCLDAIAAGVPVVCLRNAIRRGFHSLMEDEGGAVVVNSISELESELKRLIADESYRRSVVSKQKIFLHGFLCATGDAAADNLLRVCNGLIAEHNGERSIDPAARWISDVMMVTTYIQNGAHFVMMVDQSGKKKSVWKVLRELKQKGRRIIFEPLKDWVDTEHLSDTLLNMAVYGDGAKMICSRFRWAWVIYGILPKHIRPGYWKVKKWFVQALWIDLGRD